jgi:ferritin
MQLSEALTIKLNDQINSEFVSAQIYLSMSIIFNKVGYLGFAKYMRDKFNEETSHALDFISFLESIDANIILQNVICPTLSNGQNIDNPVNLFQLAYSHERLITGAINDICELAARENSYAVLSFIKKFIDEQVEEENEALNYCKVIDKISGDAGAIQAMSDQFLVNK